jgi:hypothetical protein
VGVCEPDAASLVARGLLDLARRDLRGSRDCDPAVTELCGDHPRIAGDVRGTAREVAAALLEHVRTVGERERELRVLLDEHHGEPFLANRLSGRIANA